MVRHFDDYWKGHTMSDYAWSLMSPECQACQTHAVFNAGNYMYAGVGHVCCYYEKVLKIGFQGIIKGSSGSNEQRWTAKSRKRSSSCSSTRHC